MKNFYFICSLFFFNNLKSFDVKVLLEKNVALDQKGKCDYVVELTAKDGFVISQDPNISVGYEYLSDSLKIGSKNGQISINNKPASVKLVYITPRLSKDHVLAIQTYIAHWLDTYQDDLSVLAEILYPLFDQIVKNNGRREACDYELLDMYATEVFDVFFQDFVNTIDGHRAMTAATLLYYGKMYIKDHALSLFLESLSHASLTVEEKKKLKIDKAYRDTFFIEQLQMLMQRLLYDFVPAVPRKILQQFLKAEVGYIGFKGHDYLGSFLCFQEKKNFFLINSLDIDDYLLSVMRHEGWPGWPHEMNKVFAVTCRTYLVWQVLQAQKINRPYHIGNSAQYQIYKGCCRCDKLKKAVEDTKDLFVSYNEKPALTMYDICCGGVTPGDIDDPGYRSIPYLARKYPCTFCDKFKVFNWRVTFSYEEVLKRIQKDFKIKKITDISVYKKDRAGLVQKIVIHTGARKIIITAKKMKSLFHEIKSCCFVIKREAGKQYLIQGRGFGHHKGLCQWGAYALVKDEHWNFNQVLQYYFPGTKLMKLSYQR